MTNKIIQADISKNIWKQNSLQFNIMVQIAGADIQITDLNIDFDITKTNKAEANKSTITLWNLNETTYQRILEKTYAVDLYTWFGNDEPALIFRGYVDKNQTQKKSKKGRKSKSKGFLEPAIKQDIRGGFDIPTVITLIDGGATYRNAKINKNYREKVTSTQIIKDCIEAMGLGVSRFSENLPSKEFSTYKAVGSPHVILQQICKPLGIKFSIQNDLIQVIAPDTNFKDEFAILLNPNNSQRPGRQGDNEFVISTRLIPFVNPNDWVNCDFTEILGVHRVSQVHSIGNNYGTAGSTEIMVKGI